MTLGWPGRPGAGGDHNLLGGHPAQPPAAVIDLQLVRVGERRSSGQDRHPVAGQLAAHDIHFPADHVAGPGGQVGDGDLVLEPVALPVHLPLVDAGEVEHRLAQGLGWDRPGVQADPADHVAALHDSHPALELGRGDGRLLPARAGADHQQVEVVHNTSVPIESPLPKPTAVAG